MKLQPLERIQGSDLLALPSDPEQLAIVAQLNLGARGGDYRSAKPPTNQVGRINLWRQVNETIAAAFAEDDEPSDLARIEAALGITSGPAEAPARYEVERRKIAASSKARAECNRLLEAGYTP